MEKVLRYSVFTSFVKIDVEVQKLVLLCFCQLY